MLYCGAKYCALYCTVLHGTARHRTVLHCTVLYCTALYCTALYFTVLHGTVVSYAVLQCLRTVGYCTVLYHTTLQMVLATHTGGTGIDDAAPKVIAPDHKTRHYLRSRLTETCLVQELGQYARTVARAAEREERG